MLQDAEQAEVSLTTIQVELSFWQDQTQITEFTLFETTQLIHHRDRENYNF